MNARTSALQRHQTGIAIVEFVIIAPFLLLMMLMVTELGRALYEYNALAKAVRDGARYYSAPATFESNYADLSQAEIRDHMVKLVTHGNIDGDGEAILPGTIEVADPVTETNADGTFVTITADYTFEFLPGNPLKAFMQFWGGDDSLPSPFVLTASTVMRVI